MNRSLATALALGFVLASTTAPRSASAQAAAPPPGAVQCNDFIKLRTEAEQKALLVKAAGQHKEDREGMCTAITRFSVAEAAALKFLQDNMTWCGIPAQVVTMSKENHDKTVKFRDVVCNAPAAPKPKPPTLSDAISTPTVDTNKNTSTGQGTFDTLTGNPLKR